MTADAVLVLSFGGPEGPDDVMPFLANVTRGRNVPDERLAVVAEQYAIFGGRSPINDQNLSLIGALRNELTLAGFDLPIYFGNRNWDPYLRDTVLKMKADGIGHALVFATSAFGSYSGCRQYRENLQGAVVDIEDPPALQKLRLFYNHPGFIEAAAARVTDVFRPGQRLVFTAHSIPNSMAASSDYEAQLTEAAGLIADRIGYQGDWDLVYQSRSGPPQVPWLEPDISDHLAAVKADVCLVPLGFISDHTEVLYDLDFLAKQTAVDLGLNMVRAQTVGTHPRFIAMIRELIEEQLNATPRLFLGNSGAWPDECPEGHCVAKRPSAGAPTRQ